MNNHLTGYNRLYQMKDIMVFDLSNNFFTESLSNELNNLTSLEQLVE